MVLLLPVSAMEVPASVGVADAQPELASRSLCVGTGFGFRRPVLASAVGCESFGGSTGWYSFPLAWAVRGWADRLLGGVGLRRGRRDPNQLRVGEALDWWRVEDLEHGRLLRLRAEMKVPGRAWLELRVEPDGSGGSTYCQQAVYAPHGLAGHAYWWSVTPFHSLVFGGMARNIVRAAERLASDGRREDSSTEPDPRANAMRS